MLHYKTVTVFLNQQPAGCIWNEDKETICTNECDHFAPPFTGNKEHPGKSWVLRRLD
jgi:hypothetical protein